MKASKSLLGVIALGSALAMPVAFAQEADAAATQDSATQAAPQTAQPADAAAMTEQNSVSETPTSADASQTPASDTKQLTWADLDSDQSGGISKTEAESLTSLKDVFDQADADADGNLTADEYKAFVAKSGAATTPTE